jgi:hypothetical protein
VGLKAKLPKCEFGATNVRYLGLILTPKGILLGVDKRVKAVKDTKTPRTIKEVGQFTGVCHFFKSHI